MGQRNEGKLGIIHAATYHRTSFWWFVLNLADKLGRIFNGHLHQQEHVHDQASSRNKYLEQNHASLDSLCLDRRSYLPRETQSS